MRSTHPRRQRGFTLIELLVVMGILVLLAVLTGITVSQVSENARLSSGVNQVTASLGTARSLAIKKNRPVMLLFLVTVDPERPQDGERVVMQLAESTGQIHSRYTNLQWYDERYVPIVGLPAVELPEGINVAGPVNTGYRELDCPGVGDGDEFWITQPGGEWRSQAGELYTQEIGRQIGVIFSPTGQVVTRNIMGAGGSGSVIWPFFDGNYDRSANIENPMDYTGVLQYVAYDAIGDEPDVFPVQWLAVYDDDLLRETKGDEGWTDEAGECERVEAITKWVNQFGVPILFNRYTGIAEVYEP